jgi:hypothetical protein
MKFFPREGVYKVGSMSTKVLVRQRDNFNKQKWEPLDEKIRVMKEKESAI